MGRHAESHRHHHQSTAQHSLDDKSSVSFGNARIANAVTGKHSNIAIGPMATASESRSVTFGVLEME